MKISRQAVRRSDGIALETNSYAAAAPGMVVPYRHWRWYTRIGSVVAAPAAVYAFVQPLDGRAPHPLLVTACWVLMGFLGCSGAAVAILTRTGIIQFLYTRGDQRRWDYRLAKSLAERELRNGLKFAHSYYAGFGLPPPSRS